MSDLEHLYAVQVLDSTIDQLVYRRAHLEQRVALVGARQALAKVKSGLAENTARQQALDARYAELERHGADAETRRARLEGQLRTIVVTREAEALQRQIAQLRAERETADEEGLVVLEEMESLAAEADRLGAEMASREGDALAAAEALAAVEAEVDAELADTKARRVEAAAVVPAHLVAHYEGLRPNFKGVAVAKLVGPQCTGCHLNLSRVELEAVWAVKDGEIVECPQCGRILVK